MKAKYAERIRFGILSARELNAPERLIGWQQMFLVDHQQDGWIVGDIGTAKAYDRQYIALRRQA